MHKRNQQYEENMSEYEYLQKVVEKDEYEQIRLEELKEWLKTYRKKEIKNFVIEDSLFLSIVKKIEEEGFFVDGCMCGQFGYKVDKGLYLYVNRGCHKSGRCSIDYNWEIIEVSFYKDMKFLDNGDVEVDPFELLNIQLCEEQLNYIVLVADETTQKTYGYSKEKRDAYTYEIILSNGRESICIGRNLEYNKAQEIAYELKNKNPRAEYTVNQHSKI